MLRRIGKQFRKPSGFLGRIVLALMKKGNNSIYDKLVEKIDIQNRENLFEIGYGHGLGIEKILLKKNCFISGIDFSELMHKEASKRNKRHIDNGKVKLYYGDFLKYNMDSEKYDKILCLNVVYFWDDLEIPFSKIRDGLKDRGILFLYMDHPDQLAKLKFTKDDIFKKYTIDQVVETLITTGFNEINFQHDKGYYIHCKK